MIFKVPSISEDFESMMGKVWHNGRQNFLIARTAQNELYYQWSCDVLTLAHLYLRVDEILLNILKPRLVIELVLKSF